MSPRTLPLHLTALCAAAIALQAAGPAAAQQQNTGQVVAPAAKPAKSATAATAAKPDKGAGDSGLRQRVDALEEQLADLQVAIGTLESFAKSNGAASASPAYRAGAPSVEGAGGDPGRVAGLEQQIRTLSAQVQALTDQVRTLSKDQRSQAYQPAPVVAAVTPPASAGFGTQTVTAEEQDPINGLIKDGAQPAASPAADPAVARQAYEAAYSYLLQQDYGAAETAFDDFLKRYPNDNLAGNAQFWLGESFFVRGQYKPAAAAFLKGYQSYGRSAKAPDSLLKLAMSLSKLGQKDAACSSLSELSTRFPAASVDVKSKAVNEKQRMGCV